MDRLRLFCLCIGVTWFVATPSGATTTLLLDVTSDPTSIFYEYFSDGFYRMDLFATTQPTHQNFHNIQDPNIQYGQGFDGFPNDENFRFGRLDYDESSVVGGTGDATITGLTFGVRLDPFDSTYENYRRWSGDTTVNDFTGTVELLDGAPVGLDLTINFDITVTNPLNLTGSGNYSGTFVVDGIDFTLQAEGEPEFMSGTDLVPFGLEWGYSGEFEQLTTLADPPGDYDRDNDVTLADYQAWASTFGGAVSRFSGADGNGDGMVDAADYAIWRDSYSPPVAEAGAVPEPAGSMLMFLVVALGAAARYRNHR